MMNTGNGNIIILSQPIRTGKTTTLMYVVSSKNADRIYDGIVCPDIAGSRKLLFIAERRVVDLEIPKSEDSIIVGRFFFDKRVFDEANEYLVNLSLNGNDIIVDEVGKLELNNQGFHLGVSALISKFQSGHVSGNLILVVRDSLLNQVVEKYNLKSALIWTVDDYFGANVFKFDSVVNGLVLCGGQSSRMGRDKAFIDYYAVPQYQYLRDIFHIIGLQSLISCRANQITLFNDSDELVIDDEKFVDSGPMSGLLSAFNKNEDRSFLLVGCDYPLLTIKHLAILLSFKDFAYPAICFVRKSNPDILEPLVTFYHYSCRAKLFEYYNAGNRSLNKFLSSINTVKIVVSDERFLKSFDSPDDFLSFY